MPSRIIESEKKPDIALALWVALMWFLLMMMSYSGMIYILCHGYTATGCCYLLPEDSFKINIQPFNTWTPLLLAKNQLISCC